MGRNEAGEEQVRKLQVTGEDIGRYMVTLPKEPVKKLGWREHQKLTVHAYSEKLVIEDWQE